MVLAVGGDGLGGWGVDGVLGHVFWVGWADHQTLIQHPWHAAALGVMCFWNVVGLGGLVRAWGGCLWGFGSWGWLWVGVLVLGMPCKPPKQGRCQHISQAFNHSTLHCRFQAV